MKFIKAVRFFCNAIFVILILLGVISIISSIGKENDSIAKKLTHSTTIGGADLIMCDSNKNVYVGNSFFGTVQIFNSNGIFQYGYYFPTNGGNMWMCLNENALYVYVIRTSKIYVIAKGELQQEMRKSFGSSSEFYEYFSIDNKNKWKIKFSGLNRIVKIIKNDEEVDIIHIDAPNWPYSFSVGITVCTIGAILMFCLNMKKIGEIFDRIKE